MANPSLFAAGANGDQYDNFIPKASSSLAAGDWLFMGFWSYNDPPAVASCSGWTLVTHLGSSAGANPWALTVLRKFIPDAAAAAAENALSGYAVTPGGTADYGIGQVLAIRNADPTTPTPTGGISSAYSSAGSISVPGATVARSGSLALAFGASDAGATFRDYIVSPTGWTQRAPLGASLEFGTFNSTASQNAGTSLGMTGSSNADDYGIAIVITQPAAAGTAQAANTQFFAAASG